MFIEAFRPVAEDLEGALTLIRSLEQSSAPCFHPLLSEVMAHPGKRLRPGLFLLAARAGGPARPAHQAVAAGLELIHIASLVHDDILDGAMLRRHRPTLNARWDNRVAVLFGDFLFSSAFRLSEEAGMERMLAPMARIISAMCNGEGTQATLGQTPAMLTPAQARAVATGKTAFFLSEACRMGALAGGGPARMIESLGRFGMHLGLAYQFADDVLDLVGSEEAEGKTLRTDLILGRPTMPLALLLERAPQAAGLLPATDAQSANALLNLMQQTQAIEAALDRAQSELDSAEDALAQGGHLNGMDDCFSAVADGLRKKCDNLRRQAAPVAAEKAS